MEEYLKALYLQPENILEHIQLAQILWQMKQKTLAIEHLQNIIFHSPQLDKAHLLLAQWQAELQTPSKTENNNNNPKTLSKEKI